MFYIIRRGWLVIGGGLGGLGRQEDVNEGDEGSREVNTSPTRYARNRNDGEGLVLLMRDCRTERFLEDEDVIRSRERKIARDRMAG